jgi:hypothetical protein
LKNDGVEVYGVSYGTPSQAWHLAEWSSDCKAPAAFQELKSFFTGGTPLAYQSANCENQGYFYQVTAGNDVQSIYRSIVNRIKLTNVLVGSQQISRSEVDNGFGKVFSDQNLKCDATKDQDLPFALQFSGYGKVDISNVKAMYCPVQ